MDGAGPGWCKGGCRVWMGRVDDYCSRVGAGHGWER